MALCAFLNLEEATSFMADVIFSVDFTDPMRSFISRKDAILTVQMIADGRSFGFNDFSCALRHLAAAKRLKKVAVV